MQRKKIGALEFQMLTLRIFLYSVRLPLLHTQIIAKILIPSSLSILHLTIMAMILNSFLTVIMTTFSSLPVDQIGLLLAKHTGRESAAKQLLKTTGK